MRPFEVELADQGFRNAVLADPRSGQTAAADPAMPALGKSAPALYVFHASAVSSQIWPLARLADDLIEQFARK